MRVVTEPRLLKISLWEKKTRSERRQRWWKWGNSLSEGVHFDILNAQAKLWFILFGIIIIINNIATRNDVSGRNAKSKMSKDAVLKKNF